jgi:hypothetical protein
MTARRSILLLAAALLASSSALRAASADLRFEKLNHAYKDLVSDLPEMRQGNASLRLSSPRQTVILRDHRLHLVAVGPGTFDAVLGIDFLGKGWLVADVTVGTLSQRFEDELVVPTQARTLGARIRIERGQNGYLVTPLTLPASLPIDFHSRLGDQVVDLCNRASMLLLGTLDCSWIERSVTRVDLPLPPAGQPMYLADDDLTPLDRQHLDALLAATQ